MPKGILLKYTVPMMLIVKVDQDLKPVMRKVKGTIHWVSVQHCFDAQVNELRSFI